MRFACAWAGWFQVFYTVQSQCLLYDLLRVHQNIEIRCWDRFVPSHWWIGTRLHLGFSSCEYLFLSGVGYMLIATRCYKAIDIRAEAAVAPACPPRLTNIHLNFYTKQVSVELNVIMTMLQCCALFHWAPDQRVNIHREKPQLIVCATKRSSIAPTLGDYRAHVRAWCLTDDDLGVTPYRGSISKYLRFQNNYSTSVSGTWNICLALT